MIQKFIKFTVLSLLGYSSITAQNLSDGFLNLNLKRYQEAKKEFSALITINPENSVALFGIGEYYYYTGKSDSAKIFYLKGIDANSSYGGNYAGLGKINYNSSPVDAEVYFKDAIKKSKKDAIPIESIAKFYYDQTPKKLDKAKQYIKLALEINNKCASSYYLNGLIELENRNFGEASTQFETAIYFDPKQLDAYLYEADILNSTRNIQGAIDYVNKAIAVDQKFWPAYKYLGDLYYSNQKYPEAITNFEIYFKNVDSDNDMTHYAYSLFFNKQYTEARELIEKLIQQNPNDHVLLRLLGYISLETKDLNNGKMIMEKFFAKIPSEKILNDDYVYYGKLLSASGFDSLAMVNFKLALSKDSTQYHLFDELAKSSNKLKKYDLGLKYSSQYVRRKPNLMTADYFQLGKAYYSIANSLDSKTDSLGYNVDSVKIRSYYLSADSLFTKVETYSPNSYLGTFWRARVNSAIDAETTLGLAKPFYEKALVILIKDPVKYKKELTEIYSYLGFYYFVKEDKTSSIEYWKKLLEIDPENPKAQEAIKALESKK